MIKGTGTVHSEGVGHFYLITSPLDAYMYCDKRQGRLDAIIPHMAAMV